MKRQRQMMLGTVVFGGLIYGFCLFILVQFNKQEQINHITALKADYQVVNQANQPQMLAAWADDHQLRVLTINKRQPQNVLQQQATTLLNQDILDSNHPYRIQKSYGQKYIFYLLTPSAIPRRKVIVKKYLSVWARSNLVWLFSGGYLALFLILLASQLLAYRNQKIYLQAVIDKLKRLNQKRRTPALIALDNTPYTDLIKTVNAVTQYTTQLEATNQLLEQSFFSLLRHLPLGIMLLDEQGNVILHNQALVDILGKDISDQAHPFVEDIKTYALSRMIEHTLRKSRNHHQEIQLIGDSNCFVDANVIEIARDQESTERQVIVILYDLTHVHQLEQQQKNFIANISHELKTPITAILGFAETLLNGAQDDPVKNSQFIQIIQEEAQRLVDLIEDALALVRLEQTPSLTIQRLNVSELVEQILQQQQPQIAQLQLQVTTEFQGDVWVKLAGAELRQILENLLTNAVKYNRLNGQIHIQIQHDAIKKQLRIKIVDTGIGIAAEDQQHVFERFYRADKSRNNQISGTGLGLAITQQAVEALHGQIILTSQLKQGTTVTVLLPL